MNHMDKNTALLEKIAQYQKEGIQRIKLGLTDIDGVLRGKYISLEKFASMEKGAGFCDCILGWDLNDQLYDNTTYTGWHTAFPDVMYRLDLSTERRLVEENNTPYFIGEFFVPGTDALHPLCPRSLLKRVLKMAEEQNLRVRLAFEYEFFVFKETPHSVREKNYQHLTPLYPGNFGYSVLRASSYSELFQEFMNYCIQMNFPVEGLHCETGPGVWEAAIGVDDALSAADKAALFKTFTKVFFQKRNMMATFMAKWSLQHPGQSGHCHQSLYDFKTGESLFYDENGPYGMSRQMQHYVAGLQKYLKPFLVLYAPTINSYTRLVKGAWAPTSATWGVENRTTALRVISGTQKSQRVEFRLSAADTNPYLVAAANIASGLLGIQQKLPLEGEVKGSAYEKQHELPEAYQLSNNLRDAISPFLQSKEAMEVFGSDFVQHYAASREWEAREYERSINDWQLRRYFEII